MRHLLVYPQKDSQQPVSAVIGSRMDLTAAWNGRRIDLFDELKGILINLIARALLASSEILIVFLIDILLYSDQHCDIAKKRYIEISP